MSENRSATSGNFSAADLRRRMAEREAAKAAEEMHHTKEQEEKQKAVMEEFHKPPDRTPDQLLELVMQLVNRAAERGQSEVQIYRFPNSMCSDGGRRINNSLPEWEKTLEGRPKLGYEFWRDHLRPLAFGLRAEVLEYPGGCPATSASFSPGSPSALPCFGQRTPRHPLYQRVGRNAIGNDAQQNSPASGEHYGRVEPMTCWCSMTASPGRARATARFPPSRERSPAQRGRDRSSSD
jgi:hypothetical protein